MDLFYMDLFYTDLFYTDLFFLCNSCISAEFGLKPFDPVDDADQILNELKYYIGFFFHDEMIGCASYDIKRNHGPGRQHGIEDLQKLAVAVAVACYKKK